MYSLRIGTAGWTIPKALSDSVPQPGAHLERYARAVTCVEINSSFYRPHRPATWARWAASVPDDFRFSVKAPKTITHDASLACTRDALTFFLDAVVLLGDKLGPILFQLPPKSPFEPAKTHTFLKLYRSLHHGQTVFEPRHPSWFTPEAIRLLTDFEIARAAVDPAPVPAAATPAGASGVVYHRLHGSPRIYYSDYSAEYLATLAATVAHEREKSDVWCIFDNTALGHALENVLTLQRLVTSEQDGSRIAQAPAAVP